MIMAHEKSIKSIYVVGVLKLADLTKSSQKLTCNLEFAKIMFSIYRNAVTLVCNMKGYSND